MLTIHAQKEYKMSITQLKAEQLYKKCTLPKMPSPLKQTKDSFTDVIGQELAEKALLFAMNVKADGYNAFCAGDRGVGKTNLTLQLLSKCAASMPTPEDVCYVQTIQNRRQPVLIRLPAGKAPVFEQDLQDITAFLTHALPESLYAKEYAAGIQAIKAETQHLKDAYLSHFKKLTRGKRYVKIIPLEKGFYVSPAYKGKPVPPEEFPNLPQKIREKAYKQMQAVKAKLAQMVYTETCPTDEARIEAFNQKYFTSVVQKAFAPIRYINTMAFVDEIVRFALPILTSDSDESLSQKQERCQQLLQQYRVYTVATHPAKSGAPVVFAETNLTPTKLFGYTERGGNFASGSEWGLTGGLLHQANGGFLVCRAVDITESCWPRLLGALKTHSLSVDDGESHAGLNIPSIGFNVKVVLLGSAEMYAKLCDRYMDFFSLFQIVAPFVHSMERTPKNVEKYASLLVSLAKKYKLKPLTKGAIERLIELSSRMINRQTQLTAHISGITTIMKEAQYWAKDSDTTQATHIEQALQADSERSNTPLPQILRSIKNQQLLICVSGRAVGQLNILSVADCGRFCYGRTSRTTCRTRIGTGLITDVETNSKLGGSTYAKGIAILQAFMASQFGQTEPICVDASLVIEQSYNPIDGDSASGAQLCALLSAIGEIPITQDIAITGSVNQLGQMQNVGSVSAKIEGYFDVCKELGFTGLQGVVIPKSCVCQLMLRADVIKAVKDGLFHVWAVEDVYDAMEVLTGESTDYINGRIRQRLHQYFVDRHRIPDKG